MRRSTTFLALLSVVCMPAAAEAQRVAKEFGWPHFSVTPFVGFRVGYDHEYDEIVRSSDGEVLVAARHEAEVEGGPVVGFEADARIAGPLSVQAAIGYDPAADARVASYSADGVQFGGIESPAGWFGKLGMGLWLTESFPDRRLHRPIANAFAGVAARRVSGTDYDGVDGSFEDSYLVWGANFGFKGETPIRDRLVFQFAAEDYWTFWNDQRVIDTTEALYRSTGTEVRANVSQDASHLVVLRAGVSFRF